MGTLACHFTITITTAGFLFFPFQYYISFNLPLSLYLSEVDLLPLLSWGTAESLLYVIFLSQYSPFLFCSGPFSLLYGPIRLNVSSRYNIIYSWLVSFSTLLLLICFSAETDSHGRFHSLGFSDFSLCFYYFFPPVVMSSKEKKIDWELCTEYRVRSTRLDRPEPIGFQYTAVGNTLYRAPGLWRPRFSVTLDRDDR